MSKLPIVFTVGLIVGTGMTVWLTRSDVGAGMTAWLTGGDSGMHSDAMDNKQPLYWVAPMDPNYRRDAPGKSPMGMDLVPVYAENEENSPGTIRISPDVVNNFGVRTAEARYRPLQAEIKTVGYVQYDEDRLVHIHPRVEGWVERLYVKASGEPVEAGKPLYELYAPELVNAQQELVLALGRNSHQLIQAAENRLRALQIDTALIAQIKRSQSIQHRLTFFAPGSGVVDNLNIREGMFVAPGDRLMSIGNLDQVWVEAEVFARQVALLATGLPVTMRVDYLPGEYWEGEVDYIYPTLDATTRAVRVRLRFDNADGRLKPNMYAQVTIHAGSDEKVLMVPREAVIRTGSQDRVVLALGEGRFKSLEINLGRQDDQFAEILDGLIEGDRVVTSAQFLLDSESSKTSDFMRMSHDEQS